MLQLHSIAPVVDPDARILILGSFPSVASRTTGFYYGHPRNRFWQVLSAVLQADLPQTVEEKKHLLHAHHIALWDVVARCEIHGSDDASIRAVVPNDLRTILAVARILRVYTNGGTADRLYRQYCLMQIGLPAHRLPSTSPANASWSLNRLIAAWRCVVEEN